MMEGLRPRSIYDVMAAIACFGVLAGGTAYAAASIGSEEVIDGSLRSVDIRDGTLSPFDIQPESLSSGRVFGLDGTDVDDDGLKGTDIDESSLGDVPRAREVAPGGVGTEALRDGSVTWQKLAREESWHYIGDPGRPGFENGWVNYSAGSHDSAQWQHASYRIDRDRTIHVRGLVKGGTVNQPMFHLPDGYCPWYRHTMAGVSANAFAQLTVTRVVSGSGCAVFAERGSSAWVSLDGLSFQHFGIDGVTEPAPGAARSAARR